ncbi:DUF2845 domain-containing protein [Aliiglaciecola sp. 3_MG-2023]|uniref:DUF2845 domain-containing protein n=1 Tax=Aliiglaciecola sp. 3_MG-2023 TaxID=3062644 RepID=UPI0026E12D0E|nr:DUF2845 domain-containing protein [Aliiglaciecola sp. 3_MG-2023]MDO6694148.1 DUF2845 domain-containing protein [Aliiglaciecola sp. 3_MG-2023]
MLKFRNTIGFGLLLTISILSHSVYADTLRCGSKLIKTGDTSIDVILICGEPTYKEDLTTQQRKHRGVKVERFLYVQPKGQFHKILEFHDGVLIKIENGPRS